MYLFMGGTPAAGKSTAAKQFIQEADLPIEYVCIDDLRKDFTDPQAVYWSNFFLNQNETEYWQTITKEKHVENLVKQSEAFWLSILETVNKTKGKYPHAIFEGVNLLPHLTKKDFDFPGFFVVTEDEQTLFQRLQETPRWGKTEELQKLVLHPLKQP